MKTADKASIGLKKKSTEVGLKEMESHHEVSK